MKSLSINYQSYLLRIWQERVYGTWRASLTDISTRECHAFSNINTLYTFLHEKTLSEAESENEFFRVNSQISDFLELSEEEEK